MGFFSLIFDEPVRDMLAMKLSPGVSVGFTHAKFSLIPKEILMFEVTRQSLLKTVYHLGGNDCRQGSFVSESNKNRNTRNLMLELFFELETVMEINSLRVQISSSCGTVMDVGS